MADMNTSFQGGTNAPNTPKDFSGQAKALAREVKDKAGELSGEATQIAKDQTAKLGAAAKELAGEAGSHIRDAALRQRAAGADYISAIATATERAAGEFSDAMPQAARYIHQASEHMQSFADVVRERDVRELLGEVESFARRQPTLFFGGAVILGFAALRFLKSSAPPAAPSITPEQRQA